MKTHQYVEVVKNYGNTFTDTTLASLPTTMFSGQVNHILESDGKVIFVDLDGTLRGGKNRLHLLPSKEDFQAEKDDPNGLFEEFNKACGLDDPIFENIDKVKEFNAEGYFIVLLTSCTAYEESIESTIMQMHEWGVPFDTMIMRSPNNQEDAINMKTTFFKNLINLKESFKNITIFDDNEKTIKACGELGITTLLAGGSEFFKHHGNNYNEYNNISSK